MNIPFLHRSKNKIESHNDFVFLSPHLDDAVLSCGLLISRLFQLGKSITIVTVFTDCTTSIKSPQARAFLQMCNYKSGKKLFADRRKEDKKAANLIKAKIKHLGFIDAAWRMGVNKKPIYKTDKEQFSGKFKHEDGKLVEAIQIKINKFTKNKDVLIFAPLSVGGHADHVIINSIANKFSANTLFWKDQPYSTNKINLQKFTSLKKYKSILKLKHGDYKTKERLISCYKSQLESLFPSGSVKRFSEEYFSLKN